jgi:hypothetical protein
MSGISDIERLMIQQGATVRGVNLDAFGVAPAEKKKPAKYRNRKVTIGEHTFDSEVEAKRYLQLIAEQAQGTISGLELQPSFHFELNGVLICTYKADFAYIRDGVRVVEDCKSAFTRKNREWRRTKKMMLAFHGIEVVEVLSKGGA